MNRSLLVKKRGGLPTLSGLRMANEEERKADGDSSATSFSGEETPISSEMVTPSRVMSSFWLLGLLNNASYVIMIAAAKSISNGGVALVYLAANIPGSMTKASSPFWFDLVGYRPRLVVATALMFVAFALAGPVGGGNLGVELLGVACCSAQSALGEASLLALASRYPNKGAQAVAAWSSGTGFAGVFGYAWVVGLSFFFNFGEIATQTTAMILLPPAFAVSFLGLLAFAPPQPVEIATPPRSSASSTPTDNPFLLPNDSIDTDDEESVEPRQRPQRQLEEEEEEESPRGDLRHVVNSQQQQYSNFVHSVPSEAEQPLITRSAMLSAKDGRATKPAAISLTFFDRIRFALGLWPVTGAVFFVYFSEYAMQSGIWAAMGFPVSKKSKRDSFYEIANWLYQCGVLVSRSSGFFIEGTLRKQTLWSLAAGQFFLLVFFAWNAASHFWYDPSIYVLCFVVGLFGGAVYVFGFRTIAANADPKYRELAMTIGAFACDSGVLLSNVMGLFLQGCLYDYNDIQGATVPMHFCKKHHQNRR